MLDKDDLHADIIKKFNNSFNAVADEREQCINDRRFYSIAGAQWEGLEKEFENKPMFEVNKVHLSVIRIFNEYRNNRISVSFVTKDGAENEDLADTCASLYRATEADSVAEESYDNAFEEAVGGGFGAWRLCTKYEDEEDEEDDKQKICIQPIYDADSTVFFDHNAKRYDKSDARYCFVITSYTKEAYELEFGDAPMPTPLTADLNSGEYDWVIDDVYKVAEYYVIEDKKENISIFEGLDGQEVRHSDSEIKEDPALLDTLAATGYTKVGTKKVTRKKVRKYVIDGQRIIEDLGYLVGKNIPIVPVYGKRWVVDGIERCMGHVRLSKDAQRLKNMQISKIGQIAASSATSKPVFVAEQMIGNELMWAQDNIKNYPYLLINQLRDAGDNPIPASPVMYTKPPEIPPAMAALVQLTEGDMQDLLGNQQAGEKIQPNLSGKAIELVQNRLDMQTYIYMSNMSKSIKRCGEIWLSMAKEVYKEHNRKVKGLSDNNEPHQIELMRRTIKDGDLVVENNLSASTFDVAVDVGAPSASKRQATIRDLTAMLQVTQDAETAQVLNSMIMLNIEGEGVSDVRDYFRAKLVRMGALKPTDEELQTMMQEQQNTRPDPQAQFLQASAQQAEAQAEKARADTVLTLAKSEETKAKTAQTLSNLDLSQRKNFMESLKFAQDMSNNQRIDGASESLGVGLEKAAPIEPPQSTSMS